MTKAQKRIVAEMEAGQTLVRSFDVFGGWWWWLRPSAKKVNARTAEILWSDGVVVAGKEERVYSGYREMHCTLAKNVVSSAPPMKPAGRRGGEQSERVARQSTANWQSTSRRQPHG